MISKQELENQLIEKMQKDAQPIQMGDKKIEMGILLKQLEDRRKQYGIIDAKMNRIPWQTKLFSDIVNRLNSPIEQRKRFYLYYGGNGAWKCHQFEDKVLGFDWKWKLAWEIKVGDILMWPDSLPRKVNAIWGWYWKMYKITPESWESIRVNWDHQLLLVHRRRNRKWERWVNWLDYAPEWNIIQISVEDYLKKSTKWRAEAYMWRPKAINYNTKNLTIDPYFLWVWLWDWNTNSPWITSIDNEIIDYIWEYTSSLWLSLRKNWITYFLKKNVRSRYWFSWYSLLREIWVLWDKHIPLDYLTASEEQRFELLAWLIDTDWEVSSWDWRTQRYSITQKSEKLARDIMQLARSLWFRSSITTTIKNCTNHTRDEYVPWEYYRVSINWDVWRIPVKIERKKFYEQSRRHNKDWRVSKFLVEEDWEDNFYGFSLDWDHLYLDYNFIVQHNTFVGAYLTVLLALWYDGKKYNLPFIWSKKNIWICTKSWSNVKSTIAPYLLWDYSKTRIPPEEIEKITQDNGILKAIKLKNGCEIHIKTYDQGQENVQGGNPDWMWLDEEPTNPDVWGELKARTRKLECEMVITMTPLNWLTWVYDFFFASENEELKRRCEIYHVSSRDNPFTDKTWTLGMTDEEYRLRVDGSFENPTWLVYSSFSRSRNVVPYFDPKTMWDNVRYYKAIDFGTSHPTAVIFLAQDIDDNFYVFDEIRLANTELKEIVRELNNKSRPYDFEFFVRDSAAKREWLELEKQFWIHTIPADKRSKWANDMSNRRTWILMLNTLFKQGKLMIADSCKLLIKELETHYYKENGKRDGEVVKEWDDLLDALRYCMFMVRKHKPNEDGKSMLQRKFDESNKTNVNNSFRHL